MIWLPVNELGASSVPPRDGGRADVKPLRAEAVLAFPAGSHPPGRQTLSLETNLDPYYCGSTVIPDLGDPGLGPPSYILPHSPVTTHFHSFLHKEGIRRQSSPEGQEGFLLPQEFPSGCPRNISQKGKSRGHCSAV